MPPLFTVVVATWNRGRHILPTVRSALNQTIADRAEVIVVGDRCTDDTGEQLRADFGERVRWINLDIRGGSQSFGNNAGISEGQGRYIAYLGHDDIWDGDHLERLARVYEETGADIAVSGIAMHGPEGTGLLWVGGLLDPDDPEAAAKHFCPPSCVSHARGLTDEIGGWRPPEELRGPVDQEFLLRALDAGKSFASTGHITVHKFNAALRYLDYLVPDSSEQEAVLRRLSAPDKEAWLTDLEALARALLENLDPPGQISEHPASPSRFRSLQPWRQREPSARSHRS